MRRIVTPQIKTLYAFVNRFDIVTTQNLCQGEYGQHSKVFIQSKEEDDEAKKYRTVQVRCVQ